MMLENIDISLYLPHRAPMLMVDTIVRLDKEVVETVFVPMEDNVFISGGYFAEAGLVENAAQTCSAIVAQGYYVNENDEVREDVNVIGFISAIKSMRIHHTAKCGQQIHTTAALVSKFQGEDYAICTMKCTTQQNGTVLLEGEINLFLQQRPVAAQA